MLTRILQICFLFPKIKCALKREQFDDVLNIQRIVTEGSTTLTLSPFEHLYDRCKHCIEFTGDYFESLEASLLIWHIVYSSDNIC